MKICSLLFTFSVFSLATQVHAETDRDCSFTTVTDQVTDYSADKDSETDWYPMTEVVTITLESTRDNRHGKVSIPAALLPLQPSFEWVDLDHVNGVNRNAQIKYHKGVLHVWNVDKTNFGDGDSMKIEIDDMLLSPSKAEIGDVIFSVALPFQSTKCVF